MAILAIVPVGHLACLEPCLRCSTCPLILACLVSASSALQCGTEFSKASKKSDVNIAFGCQYKLDKDLTVKGKVDSEGILSASYKHKISNISTLTLASQVDTVNLAESSKHKFGLILNLTP
mmetsp:Transcript_11233/g.34605  ORF Transcript_11233/g.34605 Transcript_11233/m.34605 type:complete len:121 (-) Transcript_11233:676-1038(-)